MMKLKDAIVNTKKISSIIQYFCFGTVSLLVLYLLLMRLTTGSFSNAVNQFYFYRFWILALSFGFGLQLALYKLIKIRHLESAKAGNIAKFTGATSATTMIACCAHHAVDVLPILGVSALASFLGSYTEEFFAVGVIFNLIGISYMLMQLRRINRAKA